MTISEWDFEKELDALISAAQNANNLETARRYLIMAKNKVYAYDNIPTSLVNRYLREIEEVKQRIGI